LLPCTLKYDSSDEEQEGSQLLELPVPISVETKPSTPHNGFAASLMGCASSSYSADLVVQACTQDVSEWKDKLKRDLILAAHQPLFEKEVAEAVCVLANVDKWYTIFKFFKEIL
jgi:hypothetical protein